MLGIVLTNEMLLLCTGYVKVVYMVVVKMVMLMLVIIRLIL